MCTKMFTQWNQIIMLTSPFILTTLKPSFKRDKLTFKGVSFVFLFWFINININGYSLASSQLGSSNVYPQNVFGTESKKYHIFHLKIMIIAALELQ